MLNDAPSTTIRCPRCGYDQRGVVATWSDSCPMSGMCAECGLELHWRVLHHRQRIPKWCIEGANGVGDTSRRLPVTILKMLRPSKFWSDLKMTHPSNPRSFARAAMVMGCFIALLMIVEIGVRTAQSASRLGGAGVVQAQSAAYAAFVPYSRNPPVWYLSHQNPRSTWDPYWGAVQWPSAEVIRSCIVIGDVRVLPLQLWMFHAWDIMLWISALLVPMCFVLVPISRRRARVKWSHLFHIASYTLLFPLILMVLQIIVIGLAYHQVSWAWSAHQWVWPWLSLVGGPLMLYLWWAAAIKRFLHMPHAKTAAAMSVTLAWVITWSLMLFPAAIF